MGRKHVPVCLQAWLLTSTEMKEGSLLDMLGFPTVDTLQRYDTSLSGYAACFGGRYDSSSCSYATQKHESGSVSHKFNPFQQMDINQIGLVGSNNTSSGSNTKAWCNNDSEVQRGECGSGPLIKHDFTKFKLQRQKEYCFKHICILCVYLNNTSSLCDHIYTYTYSKLSIYNS